MTKRARSQVRSVGARLKAERERLKLTQADMATLGGVSRRSQIRFETDERSPDAHYLGRIVLAGADLLFVVTGKRAR